MGNSVTEAIVKIECVFNGFDYYRPWQMKGQDRGSGSGCIISGNRILTSAHVIADQTFIRVQRAGQAEKVVAHLENVCHESDLAILSVEHARFFEGATALEFGELPRIADKVAVYGFPEGGTKLAITEGIVSRVEHLTYAHSWAELLCCQIDAPINPGSSGGPVISNGKVVGVAFQAGHGQNMGYMVPPPVIEHFFQGLKKGEYRGTPALAIDYQNMENSSIRKQYGIDNGQTGVLVDKVFHNSPGRGTIQKDDVIMRIDGFTVADDGTVEFREGERTALSFATQRRQVGDTITIEIHREGKTKKVKVELNQPWHRTPLVPRLQYETPATYFIAGGLVFSTVTTNLLMEWESLEKAPRDLASYLYKDPEEDREQIITIIQILPDEINVGYDHFIYTVITTINGEKISNMEDVVRAFEHHDGKYHRVINERGRTLVLSVDEVTKRNATILDTYRVHSDRSADLLNG